MLMSEYTFRPVPVLAALIAILGRTIREYDQSPIGDRLEGTFQERLDRNLEEFCGKFLRPPGPDAEFERDSERDLRKIREEIQKEIDNPHFFP